MSREGEIELEDKIVLHCSREAKCKQGFTAGISNSYIVFRINSMMVA